MIGRDYNNPRSYYYRRYADRRWTPWEPVGAQIEGDHVTAVMYQGRLHVFWVTFLEQGAELESVNDKFGDYPEKKVQAPKVDVQAQLHWTELISDQWTPRASSELLTVAAQLAAFDPTLVFVSASVERSSDGADVRSDNLSRRRRIDGRRGVGVGSEVDQNVGRRQA